MRAAEPGPTGDDGGITPQSSPAARPGSHPSGSPYASELPYPEELQQMLAGRYLVERFLGQGGMGAVYKGEQLPLRRPVAIKILAKQAGADDFDFEQRFKREAYAMASLTHPNIVQVYDCGDAGENFLFISMELVEGGDLSEAIKEGRCTPEAALKLIPQICDGLQAAHERGIVHRDIKPANIFLTAEGRPKVADFGLAKKFDAKSTFMTKTGLGMGTPDYAAPEQYEAIADIDHRADIYALGVMMYQMLTGRLPRGMAQPPSVLVPGLDPRLDAVVQKAMQQDREQRYQSAREVREAIDEILAARPAHANAEAHRSGAVPAQTIAQKPTAKGPQHHPQQMPAAKVAPPPAKKRPLVPVMLGIVAVMGVVAFFVLKPKTDTKREASWSAVAERPAPAASATPLSPAPAPEKSVAVSPAPTASKPSTSPAPNSTKPAAPKEEPKPIASTPSATMPAPAKAVSPVVPPSATALQDAAAKAMPAATPQSELDQRLAALKQVFDNAAERDAGAAFKASVATLDKGYLGALDRALAAATSGGKLEEALALREEKQRIEKHEGVPSEADESGRTPPVPDTLQALRKTYRSSIAQYEATKTRALQLLYDKYDQALAAVQTELTKASKLDDALRVKTVREQVATVRGVPVSIPNPTVATTSPMSSTTAVSRTGDAAVAATKSKPFTNTLGMMFVPVPGTDILMCIHETRRRDYAAYASEAPGVDGSWKTPEQGGVPVGDTDDHPVVSVTWEDAQAFCAWLGKKEGRLYRLPTDREWSVAVGIGREEKVTEDTMPEQLSNKVPKAYPWGEQWPPPKGAGNYWDQSYLEKFGGRALGDYTDGYPTLAPVMSFKPNRYGLYDLGGNVWEWCEEWYDAAQQNRVLRGESWATTSGMSSLLSSVRAGRRPAERRFGTSTGFRCVLALSAPAPAAAVPTSVSPPPAAVVPPRAPAIPESGGSVAAATKDKPFVNSLGMKFVPVKDTNVLFCIHETRYKDYAAYAAETPNLDPAWKEQTVQGFAPAERAEDHPVTHVSWKQVQPFCAWLSKKEGRTYRLPTDREWSVAVGIGREEKWAADTTPDTVARVPGVFPWGDEWPPPRRSGNYADESLKKALPPPPDKIIIADYDDGFPTTAPVMSFKPNKFGLHDMGGNVWEWVEDHPNKASEGRVYRGASWEFGIVSYMHSSDRLATGDYYRDDGVGFRLVLVLPGAGESTTAQSRAR